MKSTIRRLAPLGALCLLAIAGRAQEEERGREEESRRRGGPIQAGERGEREETPAPRDARAAENPLALSSRLVGMEIRSEQGESVGRLRDLVVGTRDGRVAYAIVQRAGEGDDDRVVVPFRALEVEPAAEARDGGFRLVLAAQPYALDRSPAFDPRGLDDPELEQRASDALGYEPEPSGARGELGLVSKLRGVRLEASDGARLGAVSDVGVDPRAGRVLFVLVRPDRGERGAGVVPFEALELERREGELHGRTSFDARAFERAPEVAAGGAAPSREALRPVFQHYRVELPRAGEPRVARRAEPVQRREPRGEPREGSEPRGRGDETRPARGERGRALGELAQLRLGEWMIGVDLHDEEGQRLGRVRDYVVQGGSGLVELAVVKTGAELGERYVAVPFHALEVELPAAGANARAEDVRLVLAGGADLLGRAPAIAPEEVNDPRHYSDPAFEQEVLRAFPRVAPKRPAAVGERDTAQNVLLSRLRGVATTPKGEEETWVVRDVAIDAPSATCHVVLVSRGEAGELVVVPWEALTLEMRENGGLVATLDVTAEELASAPTIGRDAWARLSDPDFLRRVEEHFGARARPREASAPRKRDDG